MEFTAKVARRHCTSAMLTSTTESTSGTPDQQSALKCGSSGRRDLLGGITAVELPGKRQLSLKSNGVKGRRNRSVAIKAYKIRKSKAVTDTAITDV